MTRGELIEAILEAQKVIHISDLPDSRRPAKLPYYRDMVKKTTTPSGILHHYSTLAKQSQSLREEGKWGRMEGHIAARARAKGMSGKQYGAYVYGAMRKRGWKPKRERLGEGILKRAALFVKKDAADTINDITSKAKDITKPISRYRRAAAYRERGKQLIAHGRFDRGLVMHNRGSRVMARYAPEVIGTGVGAGLGATLGFAIPGSTEVGAVGGQKIARSVSRMVGRRRRKK